MYLCVRVHVGSASVPLIGGAMTVKVTDADAISASAASIKEYIIIMGYCIRRPLPSSTVSACHHRRPQSQFLC
uniref:Uncharacterized protein n=1 Tax=Physcomitrium patens TaxID=3218 RepID=A0A2K1KWU3_PHYPA|nr:hypothetical protein PHYPA_005236 [Physcomitrium patens]